MFPPEPTHDREVPHYIHIYGIQAIARLVAPIAGALLDESPFVTAKSLPTSVPNIQAGNIIDWKS